MSDMTPVRAQPEGGAPYVPRLSATRLKAMKDCTMQFYLSEIKKLPQKVWKKTVIGSIAHSVLEALRRARHNHHYQTVMTNGSIYSSPAIARLVRMWQIKEKVADEMIADVDPMVMLVLQQTNFMDDGATQTFDPEHEFLLVLPSGARIKGFIDRVAIHGDLAIIWDYKSQGKRFTAKDLDQNIQAAVYQLYIWKTFGLVAEVRFVMLRHPPTSRTPTKHLQVVPPSSPDEMKGLEVYLDHMYGVLQTFGATEARASYHKDEGFCRNVCSYYRPVRYWQITKRSSGALVRSIWIDPNEREGDLDMRPQIGYDEVLTERSHPGCPRFN